MSTETQSETVVDKLVKALLDLDMPFYETLDDTLNKAVKDALRKATGDCHKYVQWEVTEGAEKVLWTGRFPKNKEEERLIYINRLIEGLESRFLYLIDNGENSFTIATATDFYSASKKESE
ncbi:MAG: hypothetical protein CME61_00400 [Halobacteriovoraceae bacterium]|nr:hypothetical protein [Halobacteriovoraceae bacterium]|tara:strand:- start:108 stop:470 length:363 start_codon:yes stop_codon:yes gene_type:complete